MGSAVRATSPFSSRRPDQARRRRALDALAVGELAGRQRAMVLDRGERGGERGAQPAPGLLAQPPRGARDGEAEPRSQMRSREKWLPLLISIANYPDWGDSPLSPGRLDGVSAHPQTRLFGQCRRRPCLSSAHVEERGEDLYEDAPCGYMSAQLDGTIVRVNRTFLRWTGLERDAVVGRRGRRALSPASRHSSRRTRRRSCDRGRGPRARAGGGGARGPHVPGPDRRGRQARRSRRAAVRAHDVLRRHGARRLRA